MNEAKSYNSPIAFLYAAITYNSIGVPQASISIKNITKKTIDAYTIRIECYNNFDRPVNHIDGNIFQGISQETINPNEEDLFNTWVLHGFDNTTKIKISLREVHFTDGTTVKVPLNTKYYINAKSRL